MSQSCALRAADWRAVLRLVGECRDLGDNPRAWRAHLQAQVGRLLGAPLVIGGEAAFRGTALTSVEMVEYGWGHGFNRSALLEGLAGVGADLLYAPHLGAYFRRAPARDGTALTRQDVVPDRDWERSGYYQSVHRAIGLGHVLVSFAAIDGSPGELSGVTLARGADERQDFSPRDRALVGEAHAALAPLVGRALARFRDPSPGNLPPRAQQVLRCVLEGDGDKQIAARLGLSRYTVNGYTKTILAHFGATSRAELAARWVARGWGRAYRPSGAADEAPSRTAP